MPNIILNNPTLSQVQDTAKASGADCRIFYRGTVYENDDNQVAVFALPGSLRVDSIDNKAGCFNLLMLDKLAFWTVELPPGEAYEFEIVGSGDEPSVPEGAIPADELWPTWSAQVRLDALKEKIKKEGFLADSTPEFPRLLEEEIVGVTGSGPHSEAEMRNLLQEHGAFIGDQDIWGHAQIIVIGHSDFDQKYLEQSIKVGMTAGFMCRYIAQEDFFPSMLTRGMPVYTRGDSRIRNHEGLAYLASIGFKWPLIAGGASYIGDTEINTDGWRNHPLSAMYGYNVRRSTPLRHRYDALKRAIDRSALGLQCVVEHIAFLIRLNSGRWDDRMDDAIERWQDDLEWLRRNYYDDTLYTFIWPSY